MPVVSPVSERTTVVCLLRMELRPWQVALMTNLPTSVRDLVLRRVSGQP
jgi:hypothetical protein